MSRFTKTLLAAAMTAAVAAPATVMAQAKPTSPHTLTGNVGLFSQYIFRGLTQTNGDPAIQGGFDYAHASGFYAGVWGSNISWLTDTATYQPGSYSVELSTYLGFKIPVGDFTFDLGFLRYNYPGSTPALPVGAAKPDTNEIYGAVSWKFLTFKYSYSLGDTFGVDDARGSDYLDLTATLPIGNSGFNVVGHVGQQKYRGAFKGSGATSLDYVDWRIAVTKEFLGLNFSLGYTDTDTEDVYINRFGKNIGKGTWTVGVQKTF